MNERARVDLQAVADAARVHRSTASRALNPATRHLVGAEAISRIEAAAESLGYRRDSLAASLRTGRTMLVGVMVPDIVNPVFAPILQGIETALAQRGYSALVANAGNDPARQRIVAGHLISHRVDGLILATAADHDPTVSLARDAGIPVILVNRAERISRVPAVISDDHAGMHLAVQHLVSIGHRRIGHIAGPAHLSTGAQRLDGFRAAMQEAGLPADAVVTAPAYRRSAGALATIELLEQHTLTAIVAANDMLALGAYRALAARGLRCPDDISVVGHNDMPLVDQVAPPLTTIRIDPLQLGARAAELMLAWLEHNDAPPALRHVTLPTLVLRGSTRPEGKPCA